MRPLAPILADVDTGSILFVCAVILGLVAVAAWGVLHLRRRLWGEEPEDSHPDGFSLGDLRQLRKNGQLTDEEFERARAMVVAAAQHRAKQTPQPKKPPTGA